MAIVGSIEIEPGEIPSCPTCKGTKWLVRQRIERETDLKRVDKFADLVVEPPTPETETQALILECLDCSSLFQPQPGLWGKIEHYSEGTQVLAPDGEIESEKISGFEDGSGWPRQIQNQSEWQQ